MAIARCISNTALISVLAVLAGCTPTPTPANTASASTSATPAASASATTLSPAEQDLQDAEQAVVKLWQVVDRLTNDPQAPIQDLDTVATGATLTMFQQNLVKYRSAKWKGSGASLVEDLAAVSSGTNAEGRSTWTVTACIDGSNTTLVDADGKSVQGPPYRIRHKSTVVERASTLYVAEDAAVGTC